MDFFYLAAGHDLVGRGAGQRVVEVVAGLNQIAAALRGTKDFVL